MVYQSFGHAQERPRTEVHVNIQGLGSANEDSEKPVIFLGSAMGGRPQEPVELTNLTQVRKEFVGGDLVDAIEMAWNPSPNQPGAGRVYAMRVEQAEQAEIVHEGITILSKQYGTFGNSIQATLEEDPITESRRFIVTYSRDQYERIYTNVGNIFQVKYEGEEASAEIEITGDEETGEARKLILSVGSGFEDMNSLAEYDLEGRYSDINTLVNDINNIPDFTARISSQGDKNNDSKYLDIVKEVDIKSAFTWVTAVGADLVKQTRNDQYVSLSYNPKDGVPTDMEITRLTGGSEEEAPSTWAELLPKLADLGGYYIVPLTAKDSIQVEIRQYINDQAKAGNPMRAIVGAKEDAGFNDLIAHRAILNSPRFMLVAGDATYRFSDGRIKKMPSYMYASLVAGLASGMDTGEPVMYKHISVEAISPKFDNEQLDTLYNNGILTTEFIRHRSTTHFQLSSEATTVSSSANPALRKNGLGEITDYLATGVRHYLDTRYIGQKTREISASLIQTSTESFLATQKREGLIVTYDPNDIQVIVSGRSAEVQFTIVPAEGLEKIDVYMDYRVEDLIA